MSKAADENNIKYNVLVDIFAKLCRERHATPEIKKFDNILESLNWLTRGQDDVLAKQLRNETATNRSHSQKTNVLITGSLYLVGLSLKVLQYKID